MGQDVSGLMIIGRPGGGDPLFLDPSSNRIVDLSESIEIDNPADAIPRISYPKVSKTPLIKYPSKRDAVRGQNREIVPGVSDKAWDSWSDSVQQFKADVAYFGEAVHGHQTIGEFISVILGNDGNGELTTLDTALDLTDENFEDLRRMLSNLNDFLKSQRNYSLLTDDQRAGLDYDHNVADRAITLAKPETQNPVPITVRDIIPEIMLNFPISSSPFEVFNKARDKRDPSGFLMRTYTAYSTRASWGSKIGMPPSRAVSHAILKSLITDDDNDYIEAYDSLLAATLQAQSDLGNLLKKFRTPGNKQSASDTRKIAQLGFEIEALEKMADRYFSDDRIITSVTRRKRFSYKRSVNSLNRQREKSEQRKLGLIKVGGKLQLEDLKPKEGIVRDGEAIRKILADHKSAQLFAEINLVDMSQAVPLLTDDEIEYLDVVQEAYSERALPNERGKVTWGQDAAMNSSIAELYMALELNGFNDFPVQVTSEEAEQLLRERDEKGNPLWFLMTRYVNNNKNEPGKNPTTMVDEYREGERFPIGHGMSAGGRGDNFMGGTGQTYYGPAAIVALVSSESRIADRKFLKTVEVNVREMLKELATSRQVKMGKFNPDAGEIVDIADLMTEADAVKAKMNLNSGGSYDRNTLSTGSPLANEATAIVFTLVEHWLQLEMAKIDNPSTEADAAWNNRLINMQTGIFNMDEAQIAIFAGYDGYFSDTPTWLAGSTVEHDDWPENTGANFDGQHMMWLNRTALAVLDHSSDFNEASRLSGV
jgi:hypothetical protein